MKERQVSFAAGELSPTLHGRTDLDVYAAGAKTLKNFIVSPHGVAMNRPGTISMLPSFNYAEGTRLIPFVYSETDSRLLVFKPDGGLDIFRYQSDGTMRRCEVLVTQYDTAAKVDSIRLVQVGNLMILVSEFVAPYELRRVSSGATETDSDTWTLEEFSFAVPSSEVAGKRVYLDAPSNNITENEDYFEGDESHPSRKWEWQVTFVLRDDEGKLYETRPYDVIQYVKPDGTYGSPDSNFAVYPDWAQTIDIVDHGGPDEDVLVAARVYRGRDGLFGYIGEVRGDPETNEFGDEFGFAEFVDEGAEPDYSDPPPRGFNPFDIYTVGGLDHTEDPGTVSYFDNRTVFGGTTERPAQLWLSAFDEFTNFDETIPADAADAMTFALSSRRFELIRFLVPRRQLIVFTTSSVWRVAGAGGEALSPTGLIEARPISSDGCGTVPPVEARNTVFFLDTSNVYPKALVFQGEDTGAEVIDVAEGSRHLFDGHTIVAWDYAEKPYKILWAVRDDGVLLSFTYVPGQGVAAWCRHEITDGLVDDVCVLPDGSEDMVVLSVTRGDSDRRRIERFAPRLVTEARDGVFLDAAATYDGEQSAEILLLEDGINIGDSTIITIDGDDVAFDGEVIQVDDPDGGVPFRFLLSAEGGGVYGGVNLNRPVGELDGDGNTVSSILGLTFSRWWVCVQSCSVSDAIEDGTEVTAVLDGNVREGLVVTAGSVSFGSTDEEWYGVVHVGLPYESDLETLDAVNEREKEKITEEVIIEFEGARGGQVGPNLDELTEIRFREVSDGFASMELKRWTRRVAIPDRWATAGAVAYRQDQPLPVTILGLTRIFHYGG